MPNLQAAALRRRLNRNILMTGIIGEARPQDADELLPMLLSAIGSIAYTLSGSTNQEETEAALREWIAKDNNRLSYSNMLVDRRDGRIAGMLICYSGSDAERLDEPIKKRLEELYGPQAAEQLVTECLPDDFYLDSVAVAEHYRGQGVAKGLLAAFEFRGKSSGCKRLSLIVEPNNEKAASLYQRQGYREDGKLPVSGTLYTVMVKPLA
jgi:ribosomal protein S18 acetylase RimI-like enzyme